MLKEKSSDRVTDEDVYMALAMTAEYLRLIVEKYEKIKLKNNKMKKSETQIPTTVLTSEWIEFNKQKPPKGIVLAACDTDECGWVMDTAWWYEPEQRWMATGRVKNKPAYLPYTHWRMLPPFPEES
jgi:hypothetical protein